MKNTSINNDDKILCVFIFCVAFLAGLGFGYFHFWNPVSEASTGRLQIEKAGGGEATVSIGGFTKSILIKDGEISKVEMPFEMRHGLIKVATDGEAKILLSYCKHTFKGQIEFTGTSPTTHSPEALPEADLKECEKRILGSS